MRRMKRRSWKLEKGSLTTNDSWILSLVLKHYNHLERGISFVL